MNSQCPGKIQQLMEYIKILFFSFIFITNDIIVVMIAVTNSSNDFQGQNVSDYEEHNCHGYKSVTV